NIPFRYSPHLKKLFGDIPVVEMYSATEGVFAQQLDDLPYVSPNYDKYLFEVETGKGTKMLHELKRGEWGSLIISSCMLPRYDIGDMVEAAGENYFRVFGRRKPLTVLEHRIYRLLFGWLL
ncbi:GH3 auxin-responsive promoter family protein, partial [Candidatus Bathyarchaeota archaeon]|nr:GH3 auxin-responsive promoter family protein [Candidatus Bathyarchaeota archaeon]